jgi:hypothetical protein
MQRACHPIIIAILASAALPLQPGYSSRLRQGPPPNQNSHSELAPTKSLVYKNTQYGFWFSLPETWKGYSTVASNWTGRIIDRNPEKQEKGPLISIRHPLWTKQNPRQDIPIMVFTLAQWRMIKNAAMAVSAAAIGPSELGKNPKYVFALPARYNFAYLPGWEEVDEILQHHPLQAF